MVMGGVAFLNWQLGGAISWLNITELYSALEIKGLENARMLSYHNIF
jgi:hypothetical protein